MNFKCAALAMALLVGPTFAPVQAQDFPDFDIQQACDAQVKKLCSGGCRLRAAWLRS